MGLQYTPDGVDVSIPVTFDDMNEMPPSQNAIEPVVVARSATQAILSGIITELDGLDELDLTAERRSFIGNTIVKVLIDLHFLPSMRPLTPPAPKSSPKPLFGGWIDNAKYTPPPMPACYSAWAE